jgi:hypothetical protein
MNVRTFFITLMLFASGVFAQNTHMGVPPGDMVVLKTICSSTLSANTCDSHKLGHDTFGSNYNRLNADGKVEVDFKIPARKILVITEWEWSYSEHTVLEDSAQDPVLVMVGPITNASVSKTNLIVSDASSPLSNQGHAFGASQMTSGFVTSVLPRWTINRKIGGLDSPSSRTFIIVLRGYLLDVR